MKTVSALGWTIPLYDDMDMDLPPIVQAEKDEVFQYMTAGLRSGMGRGEASIYMFCLFCKLPADTKGLVKPDDDAKPPNPSHIVHASEVPGRLRQYEDDDVRQVMTAGSEIYTYLANNLVKKLKDVAQAVGDTPNAVSPPAKSGKKSAKT